MLSPLSTHKKQIIYFFAFIIFLKFFVFFLWKQRICQRHVNNRSHNRHIRRRAAHIDPYGITALRTVVHAFHRHLVVVNERRHQTRQDNRRRPHRVQLAVVREHNRRRQERLTARVLNVEFDLEQRAEALHVCRQSQGGPSGVGYRPAAVRKDLDIRPRRLKPQLAQLALEDAVHLDAVLLLALGLFQIQDCLFGNLQRDLLLRRRPGGVALEGLERRCPRKHLNSNGPGLERHHQRVVLAAVLPEEHRRDDVVHLHLVDEHLASVHPDLAVRQRHEHRLGAALRLHVHPADCRDRARHKDAVLLLALYVVRVYDVGHRADDDAAVDPGHGTGIRLAVDVRREHIPVLDCVDGAVAARYEDAEVNIVQTGRTHQERRRRQRVLLHDARGVGGQDEHAAVLHTHDEAPNGAGVVLVFVQHRHARDHRLLDERVVLRVVYKSVPRLLRLKGEEVQRPGRQRDAVVARVLEHINRCLHHHAAGLERAPHVRLYLRDLQRRQRELVMRSHVFVDEYVRPAGNGDGGATDLVLVVHVEGADRARHVEQRILTYATRATVHFQLALSVCNEQLRVAVAVDVSELQAAAVRPHPGKLVLPRVEPQIAFFGSGALI
eukprot:PhM_4_TR17556/c0_g1_i1/m.55205